MKLLTLDLLAYGPFTDASLDFASGGQNLHIVYGPNEAGKSSALRAITSFLYGIPVRTTDNFLHGHDELRIGARLQRLDGAESYLLRRKGNKNTLMDGSGVPVPDSEISNFLDGIPLEVFENMYGIGAESLVKGGRELVEGKGDLGEALFSAVSGIAEVRGVLKDIERKKDDLFKAKGSNPVINSLSKRYEDLKRERKESILPVNMWNELEDRIKETANKLESVSHQMSEKHVTLNHKKRIQEAFGDARELREILGELEGLKGAPKLPEDFTRRRERVEESLASAKKGLSEDAASLKSVQDELGSLDVPKKIIEQAERITDLHQKSGNYKQANQQLPRLQGDILELKRSAGRLLKDLDLPGGDDFSKYCITIKTRTRISSLCDEHKTLVSDLEHFREAYAKASGSIKGLKDKLKSLPVPGDLAALEAILKGYRQGDVSEKAAKKLAADIKRMEGEFEELKAHLSLPGMKDETLVSLVMPGKATVARFGKDFQGVSQQREEVERRQKAEAKTIAKIKKDVEAIRTKGNVPTEDDLEESRGKRDVLWGMIRTAWEE